MKVRYAWVMICAGNTYRRTLRNLQCGEICQRNKGPGKQLLDTQCDVWDDPGNEKKGEEITLTEEKRLEDVSDK